MGETVFSYLVQASRDGVTWIDMTNCGASEEAAGQAYDSWLASKEATGVGTDYRLVMRTTVVTEEVLRTTEVPHLPPYRPYQRVEFRTQSDRKWRPGVFLTWVRPMGSALAVVSSGKGEPGVVRLEDIRAEDAWPKEGQYRGGADDRFRCTGPCGGDGPTSPSCCCTDPIASPAPPRLV